MTREADYAFCKTEATMPAQRSTIRLPFRTRRLWLTEQHYQTTGRFVRNGRADRLGRSKWKVEQVITLLYEAFYEDARIKVRLAVKMHVRSCMPKTTLMVDLGTR